VFLDLLRRRNPAFLTAVVELHRSGDLPVNCFAIDLDAVRRNAASIVAEANRVGVTVFAMTKQIGRNPDVSRALVKSGIAQAVAVDLDCAEAAVAGGLRLGHVGHLVQVPRHDAGRAAALDPAYWTVFSDDKAADAAAASAATSRDQALLARIFADGDRFYRGHEGGFPSADVAAVADRLDALEGAHFAGIVTFPAALYDAHARTVKPTPNLATLQTAARALAAAGRADVEINAPGTTSTAMLAMLAEAGATQVEPGHGLTGTTPWHAVEDLVEEPAIAYVSEVSHLYANEAFVFGGGLYVDPVLPGHQTRALVVPPGAAPADIEPLLVDMPSPAAIDYYAPIDVTDRPGVSTGDTVVFGFRPQVFATRALTAAISGVSTGTPRVEGLWASDGSTPLRHEPAHTLPGRHA